MCSWAEKLQTVKILVLPKAIHRFGAIPLKTVIAFFARIGLHPKTNTKSQGIPNSHIILKKKGKLKVSNFPTLKFTTKLHSSQCEAGIEIEKRVVKMVFSHGARKIGRPHLEAGT